MKNAARLKIIPTMLLISILMAGCLPTTKMNRPAKPVLEVQTNPADPKGICLDSEDTYLLLDYIWQLEEGYK